MNTRWIDIVRLRVRSLTQRARVERELDRELRAHIEAQIEENVALGMSPAAARRAAALSFGGLEQIGLDHDRAFPRRSQPRAAGTQRGNDFVRSQHRPVMELDPGAKEEAPA